MRKNYKKNCKRVAAVVGSAALMWGAVAHASSPLVDLSILGSLTQNGTYTSSLSGLASSENVYIELTGQLAPVGTVDGTHTITTLSATTDGISSLSLSISATGSPTISNVGLASNTTTPPTTGTNTTGGSAINWSSGSGSSGGTISGSSVTGIRPTISGTDAGTITTSDVIWYGEITMGSSSSSVTGAWGTTTGGFKYNGGTSAIVTTTTESSATPYVGYSALTLTEGSGPAIITVEGTGSPTGYGSSVGNITIYGSHGTYVAGAVKFTGATAAFTQVDTFTAGDPEIFALDVHGASGTQLASIDSDISAVTGLVASTSWSTIGGSAINVLAPLFTDGGTPVYVEEASNGTATPDVGINFANDSSLAGVTLTGFAAVPEPASIGIFATALMGLLGRRRRRA